MTGTNHALTGVVIAAVISQPAIALPLAFASHFVLDSLPHFGERPGHRKKLSKTVWVIDVTLVAAICLTLLFGQYWLLLAGAIAAMSPDFVWLFRFFVLERMGRLPPKPTTGFNKWHESIQKYETREGLPVDMLWFILFGFLFLRILA